MKWRLTTLNGTEDAGVYEINVSKNVTTTIIDSMRVSFSFISVSVLSYTALRRNKKSYKTYNPNPKNRLEQKGPSV